VEPLYVTSGDGFAEVDGKVAVRRSDTGDVLGVFSDTYQPLRHADMLRLGDAIVNVGGRHYDSAGTLQGGRKAWTLLKPSESDGLTIGGDAFESYLLVSTSHDGSQATLVAPTYVRVVCQNTLSAALFSMRGQERVFRAKHTSQATVEYLERQAIQALELGKASDQAFQAEVEALQAKAFSRVDYVALVEKLAPMPSVDASTQGGKSALSRWEKVSDGLLQAWKAASVADYQGTGWGAVQAVSDYELWMKPVRGAKREERQALSALTGQAELTRRAVELVTAS
jgi:phage/plasmid-like protein (TIGR03299 family)